MMLDNNWYGHRRILADFCNINDKPSFSIIQHGWSAAYNDGLFGSKKKISPPNICWSDIVKNKCQERGVKNIHSIGSPFLYLCKNLKTSKDDLDNQSEKGTIYFPCHNTTTIKDVGTKHEKIIDEIEKVSKGPFTVCFYYADLTDENVKLYKNRNWRIVCCGNRNDSHMLHKIYIELSKHEKVIVSEISSITFYAMYLKKKIKLLKNVGNIILSERGLNSMSTAMQKEYYNKLNQTTKDYYKTGMNLHNRQEESLINTYPSLVNDFLDGENGFNIAKKELGFESLKSSAELKHLLGWSSYTKIFLSKLFSKYFDLKYGSKIRSGESELH